MALGKYSQSWDLFIDEETQTMNDLKKEYLSMFLKSFDIRFKYFYTERSVSDFYYVAKVTYHADSVVRICRFADALACFALFHQIHIVEATHSQRPLYS